MMRFVILALALTGFVGCKPSGSCPDGSELVGKQQNGKVFEQACRKPDGTKHGKFTQWLSVDRHKTAEGEYKDGERHGKWTHWYLEENRLATTGEWKKGKKHGKWTSWHKNGQKKWQGRYKDHQGHGKWTSWHDNGQKEVEGEHKGGKRIGKWTCWEKAGKEFTCPKWVRP